jgi:hypothetical protein
MKTKNDKKLEKVYAICKHSAKKYNLSKKSEEKCIMKLKIKFGVKKKE